MSDHSTYRMMYMNALIGLENGHLMPWDKDILASAPLPDSVSDPYTTKEMPDVLESMKLTFNAMSIWVDEAKKVNYFSKRFVQLSRMVMNGVTTMGRGLVTLHARGEDLSQSPMSIQDLLGVASYHFRKSYLGVLQTSRSHPEIGERLLMNQIGWNNMLMRLFKTRDKLNSEVRIQGAGAREDQGAMIQDSRARAQGPVVSGQCSVGKDQEPQALPDTSDLLVQALRERTHTSDLKSAVSTLTAPSALTEPGAFTAPRAFSSYDSVPKRGLLPKATVPNNSLSPSGLAPDGTSPIAEKLPKATVPSVEIKKEENRIQDSVVRDQGLENEEGRVKNEEFSGDQDSESRGRNKEQGTRWYKEELQTKGNDQDREYEKNQKEIQPGSDNTPKIDLPTEPPVDQPLEIDDGDCLSMGQSPTGETPPPKKDSFKQTLKDGNSPIKGQSPTEEKSSAREDAPQTDLPPYLQILKNVFARSGPSENGEVSFTFDEISYLAADPDFNRIYPDQAVQMRTILQNLNSS